MAEFPIEVIKEFVIAGHWNLAKVQEMLTANPDLLHVAYEWEPGDFETAVQAAAHTGARAVAEFLLGQGALLQINTAAMLGRQADVERLLAEKPERITENGAHGIPLLAHAAFSGNVALFEMLMAKGASVGVSFALHNAVTKQHLDLARWILEHTKPDLTWKNYENKTALMAATESNNTELVNLLKQHGAQA